MPKIAVEIHLVEKGVHKMNLQKVPEVADVWTTGNWWVGDRTANQLIGRRIFLHKGQDKAAHIGGEILSVSQAPGSDPKRKVFQFRELADCIGTPAPSSGWGNEKCIIWSANQA